MNAMPLDLLVNVLFAVGAVCFTAGAMINLARSLGLI